MTEHNPTFDLAAQLALYTYRHLFLTGKAGTGKTTFLRHIQDETSKKTAVVAPTGVAAINAGGVTMHSFFQLPFEPFIPVRGFMPDSVQVANRNNLFKKIRLSAVKREVLEELEMLIIDEVSMLRSDQLDCMDAILRGIRRNDQPFGGVQVIFIGDLYQLPPVVTDNDKHILDEYYDSPFFFDAKVLQQTELLHIELTKVYRQQEQTFVDLLNKVRHNDIGPDEETLLQERFAPQFRPDASDGFITITSHNYKADTINMRELAQLPGEMHTFKGEITGEFGDKSLPTELDLQLKPGAQVMFVRNDVGEHRRYYNGKLATVQRINGNEITVAMKDSGTELLLEKEEWKNIRYKLNKENDRMEEEELGSFKQYPVRLAWAITIHKSQGLTFDKVMIDAGQSFAAGQVYVALSRCTTLDGLVLLSRIGQNSILTEPRITEFSSRQTAESSLQQTLEKEKKIFQAGRLLQAFDLQKLIHRLKDFPELVLSKDLPDKGAAYELSQQLIAAAIETDGIVGKFRDQLRDMLAKDTDAAQIRERLDKAAHWLASQIGKKMLQPLADHLDDLKKAKRVRQYTKSVQEVYASVQQNIMHLYGLEYDGSVIQKGALDTYLPVPAEQVLVKKPKEKRAPKGETVRITLELFKQGKSAEVIAMERNLSPNTIESHLAQLVGLGEVLITQIVSDDKIDQIKAACLREPNASLTDLKKKLSDDISFGEIKAVQAHMRLSEE